MENKEKEICSTFYDQVLKPQFLELEIKQYKLTDVVYKFLEEEGFSFDEFINYLRLNYYPKNDIDFLRDLYELIGERKIIRELLREYYSSVLCQEDLIIE